ncbi:dynein regulatory complex subunit 2-like [Trichoplusia ni]|uniref:Dynein regulatory complex subunit 2 n=1 Tax=Trichoplusia ni TaxID=7111 RepID=A0A7E5W1B4_TRINI|nr:dynein regulatory complex subunit 2-like [Trichoplusia ni]
MVLTKEEKKAKKEAKKLEKLQQEIEFRKQLKREELAREIAAQALRRDELDKSWRAMMLKIKEPVFRQDIEVMWHVFERVFDKKDYLIKHTMRLMDIADDQFQRTVASFCDTIDRMINKFLLDLEDMSKENDRRTYDLLKRSDDETTHIMSDHTAAETHLQLLLYHAYNTADTLAWTTRGENMVKADEERNKYADERENLRSILENNYNAMWDEYKAVLRAYVVGTAENQKAVRKLRRKENLMADIIASQGKKIANSDGLLRRLRTELAAYESGTKQAAFRDRRNRHRDACYRLKNHMYNGVATDVKQLAILVKVSDDAVEWLEAAYKKVDRILRMAGLCRKFETQREKVLPYGSCMPHSPSQGKSNVRKQQSDDSLVLNAISTTSGLTRLWHRISRAELAKRALLREKQLLEEENALILRKVQEFNEKKITVDPQKCICGKSLEPNHRASTVHPVAIDGVTEVSKLNLQSQIRY